MRVPLRPGEGFIEWTRKASAAARDGLTTDNERSMRDWLRNLYLAIKTVGQGMYVTLWYFFQTYKNRRPFIPIVRPDDQVGGTFTHLYEYPEKPVPVRPRYRGFHRFDLTTCIGCDKCARACPVDCIYIEKIKNPVGKGFRVNGFKIDYTKCMFCALCVDPCPVDCIFMGSTFDQSCYSRDGCIVDYAKLPLEVAWGPATLNPTAVAASKLQSEPVWTKPPDPPPPPKPSAAPAPEPAPAG
jgi:NADH-quinone oxidoreductase subunit I